MPRKILPLRAYHGGIVAMEMMRQQPKRITRLALMDTNPLADPPERVALRDKIQIADIGAEINRNYP